MKYLAKVFHKVNDYPMSTLNKIVQQEVHDGHSKNRRAETNENPNKVQVILINSGRQFKKLITMMKKHIKKTLPVTYQSKNLFTKFHVKYKTFILYKFYYQSNLVYHRKYPFEICREDYIGEADSRIRERIIVRNNRDKNSHILKHSRQEDHSHI